MFLQVVSAGLSIADRPDLGLSAGGGASPQEKKFSIQSCKLALKISKIVEMAVADISGP